MKRSEFTYVYQHTDPDNLDSPVYIGIGKGHRAWQITKRDGAHRAFIESTPHDYQYVEILHTGLSDAEAQVIETGLIRELDTKFNIQKRIK